MSYSADAAVYTLTFTDGSRMSMINLGNDRPLYSGEYEYVIPNLYWGTFLGSTPRTVKYDSKGNKYDFRGNTITINDTYTFTATNGRAAFGYNPDNNTIRTLDFDTGHTIPYIRKTTYSVDGITWLRDTTGTDFNSFGDALSYAHEKYIDPPPSYNGNYKLENVVDLSPIIPLYGTTIFRGIPNGLTSDVLNSLYWDLVYQRSAVDFDLHDQLNDFDPEHPAIPDDDPFGPGGDSNPGGGGGNFDDTSDDIPIPTLPTLSAVDAGFITLFNPTTTQLKNLATYMWSGPFDIETYRKLFADPMDCFLGLSIVPVNVPSSGTSTVKVGNISTGVSMNVATSQYVEVDCGSLNVAEYWGAYLDYDPFTTASIYLPFIGTHPIAVDDIMGKTVAIKYHIDILSGACTAFIKCGSSVLYEFIGQCSSSIPISANDWTNVINGVISIAGAIGSMVATGGASAPAAVGVIASNAVNTMKPSIEKSGSMSGTGGMLGIQKPYLILTRPNQALPASQNYFTGYPSFITEELANLSGYTEIDSIHLTGIPATEDELIEIENLLKKGVIF